ncbi:MAG: hypothetical protein ACE5JG_02085 [Planctomycetota bacterium]
MRRTAAFLLLAACATPPERGPPVDAAAVREGGALRVHFRRTRRGTGGHLAVLEADGGTLSEVVHSPDRLSVSVLWREPEGRLRCTYAYGGVGVQDAGDVSETRIARYVFLDAPGARVTMHLPVRCPMRPALDLRFRLDPSRLPAVLEVPGRAAHVLRRADDRFRLELPRDEAGALQAGDLLLVLRGADGEELSFLVGVDPDGVATAASGYLRRW